LYFDIGGLDSEADQHATWLQENLKPGDTLSIKVINDNFDKSVFYNERTSKEEKRKRKIDYYYQLKEELKDYLDASTWLLSEVEVQRPIH
jgi:hypothetical protein